MKKHKRRSLAFVFVLVVISFCNSACASDTIRISLSTRDGTPIPGIGFEARTESGAYHAETNVRGIANVLIADSESDDTAFVLLDSDSAVTQQRTRAMLRKFYFPFSHPDRQLKIKLSPDVEMYELNIVVDPAVDVEIRVIDDSNNLIKQAMCFARYRSSSRPTVLKDGMATLSLPEHHQNTIFICAPPLVSWTKLDQSIATENANLEPVEITRLQGDVPLHRVVLRMEGVERLVGIWRRYAGGCTLIAENGDVVYSFSTSDGVDVVTDLRRYPHATTTSIRSGRYYVVPGVFSASAPQIAVIEAATRGGLAKDALTVIEVSPDLKNEFVIDVSEAHQRIVNQLLSHDSQED